MNAVFLLVVFLCSRWYLVVYAHVGVHANVHASTILGNAALAIGFKNCSDSVSPKPSSVSSKYV